MKGAPNILLLIATLAVGLFLTIKPEKAIWNGANPKVGILVARITGIVILSLLLISAVLFGIGWATGQITL